MKAHHWLSLAAIVLASYVVGVKYPGPGASALAKVGM
jgi:hypothetical protein